MSRVTSTVAPCSVYGVFVCKWLLPSPSPGHFLHIVRTLEHSHMLAWTERVTWRSPVSPLPELDMDMRVCSAYPVRINQPVPFSSLPHEFVTQIFLETCTLCVVGSESLECARFICFHGSSQLTMTCTPYVTLFIATSHHYNRYDKYFRCEI